MYFISSNFANIIYKKNTYMKLHAKKISRKENTFTGTIIRVTKHFLWVGTTSVMTNTQNVGTNAKRCIS